MDTKEQARLKLDSDIDKALFLYTNKIKENLYDFVMLTVKRDPQLNAVIDTATLKLLIDIAQRSIQQGKGSFVEDFNQEIKKSLDAYVGAENPTLKTSTVMPLPEVKNQQQSVTQTVQKPKISFSLPQE